MVYGDLQIVEIGIGIITVLIGTDVQRQIRAVRVKKMEGVGLHAAAPEPDALAPIIGGHRGVDKNSWFSSLHRCQNMIY